MGWIETKRTKSGEEGEERGSQGGPLRFYIVKNYYRKEENRKGKKERKKGQYNWGGGAQQENGDWGVDGGSCQGEWR